MPDEQTTQVLCEVLEMMKQQAVYLNRQHRWILALGDTIALKTDLEEFLREHPFYGLGPRPDLQITQSMIENIDALIRRLKQSQ